MNPQMTTQELREELTAHLDAVTPPPGDLDAVLRRSRRSRTRRLAGPGLLAAAAVGITALVLTQTTGPGESGDPGDSGTDVAVADGPVDLSNGLRAYASPGDKIYLGGRELPYDIEGLDTDAATTPYGIVFYEDDGRPSLLQPSGRRVQLDDGPSDPADGFSPTAKADAVRPHVAYALMSGDDVAVTVYDLEKRAVVATTGLTCTGGCADLVIDGIDSGAVFLRMQSGTVVWDYDRKETYRFSGRDTRVADVRNGVVLYDGVRPAQEIDGWRYVSGAIDAQLTFDGEHVLYWSDELESTTSGPAITLDLPVPATFFTIDTDGSVIAATASDPSEVFDCEIPTGACTKIGEMGTPHGDPLFIGSDM